jgi:hypothetical protein
MTGQDIIDFADIDPNRAQVSSYSRDASGGTLSVTDGSHSANIALLGSYLASSFAASSDGHTPWPLVKDRTSDIARRERRSCSTVSSSDANASCLACAQSSPRHEFGLQLQEEDGWVALAAQLFHRTMGGARMGFASAPCRSTCQPAARTTSPAMSANLSFQWVKTLLAKLCPSPPLGFERA